MYRDWHTLNKVLLFKHSKIPGNPLSFSALSRMGMQLDVHTCGEKREIVQNALRFDSLSSGKRSISTRGVLLDSLKAKDGIEAISQAEVAEEGELKLRKTIIYTVAIPGCGKTTVAKALVHLFNFGHTQSDDVKAKKAAPVFIKNVASLLEDHDVVIADKNNHLKSHRTALRELAQNFKITSSDSSVNQGRVVRLVALDWSGAVKAHTPATAHRIVSQRIVDRGENHQTLKADVQGKKHEKIVWMFINQLEGLDATERQKVDGLDAPLSGSNISYEKVGNGSGADVCIEMKLEEGEKGTLDNSIQRAIAGVAKVLNLEMPTKQQIIEAIKVANSHSTSVGQEKLKQDNDNKKDKVNSRNLQRRHHDTMGSSSR